MATSRRTCATVPQPSELPFGVVCAVGQGIAVLHGVHITQREGEVLGFLFPIFIVGNAIRSPTVKCFRFVFEKLTTFPFGNYHWKSSIYSWAFWRYIRFQDQRRDLWEISKKVTILLPKLRCTQQTDAARGALTAAAADDEQPAYSWMHATA